MKLKVFQAGSGDALLIESTSTQQTRRILVDAGEPKAFDSYVANILSDIDGSIDVLYVSHIDRDHIGGVLKLLDHHAAWRIFKHLEDTADARPRPPVPSPPDVGEIWHNAFFDEVSMNTPEIVSTLSGTGSIVLGHSDAEIRLLGKRNAELSLSVGDAIEVSRRISKSQLNIPLNQPADGNFLLLKPSTAVPDIGPLKITILGPTPANMRSLINDWNEWLADKAEYLAKLIKQHDRDEELLATNSPMAPITIVENQASELTTSAQRVTPPNVASLMVLVEEAGKRIILTGDADDVDILSGLEAQELLEDGGIHVDVFKVPHHGANNSFTAELAAAVTADHYVFSGNGDHGNPELEVVDGYVRARRELASAQVPNPQHLRPMKLWFNHSHHEAMKEEDEREAAGKKRNEERTEHWHHLETMVSQLEQTNARPKLRSRFLKNARSMTFSL